MEEFVVELRFKAETDELSRVIERRIAAAVQKCDTYIGFHSDIECEVMERRELE